MSTPSSILAWEIPWTEEPGGLQSIGSQESDTTEATRHAVPELIKTTIQILLFNSSLEKQLSTSIIVVLAFIDFLFFFLTANTLVMLLFLTRNINLPIHIISKESICYLIVKISGNQKVIYNKIVVCRSQKFSYAWKGPSRSPDGVVRCLLLPEQSQVQRQLSQVSCTRGSNCNPHDQLRTVS